MSVERTEKNSLQEIYNRLWRTLTNSGVVVSNLIEKFRVLDTNLARVDFAYKLLTEYKLFPTVKGFSKCGEVARKYRDEGNRLFKAKQNGLAFIKYNTSIANAPIYTEDLALAYANRSAILYEQRLYKECLQDITYAFLNNYPERLHEKLLIRKRKAELLLNNQVVQEQYHDVLPHLTHPSHPVIECGGNCIEMKHEESLGRHIIASRDIHVGDIIAIERPFAQILLKDNYLTHCYQCLTPCYNLIPCTNCVLVLFCSNSCKDKSCHKYECPILGTLLDLETTSLELMALKICMLIDNQEFNKKDSLYKSNRYEEIHNLVSNTHMRSGSDLFKRAVKAAIIFYLVQKFTNFFDDKGNERQQLSKELLLLHLQTGPSNFHEISELRRTNENSATVQFASGAYGFLSLLNHSCSPNVVRHCYKNAIVLRALRPITKGQQLFDNYGYHHAIMPKPERQKHLKDQYYFNCTCEACTDDWPLYHDLPFVYFNVNVSKAELKSLEYGNRELVNEVLEKVVPAAAVLEKRNPCKELANVQEIMKQCYAILGNKFELF